MSDPIPGSDGGRPAGRPVTIIDVARVAGVSKTTASDALSGSGRVSESTRSRVATAAAELGYSPNTAARHLRQSRVGTIGLHIPQRVMGLPFYMEFAFAAARRAQDHGLDLTLLAPGQRTSGVPRVRADGLIVIDPMPSDPVATTLMKAEVPVVCVGQFEEITPAPAGLLHADHGRAMTQLMEHLAAAGARNPAFIGTDADFQSDWAVLIRTSYQRWCQEHGVPPHIGEIATDAPPQAVDALIRQMLADRPEVDALVCGPDGTAQVAVRTLRSLGRKVGDDLLLAACVDGAGLPLSAPPVTAINLRPQPYGQAATDLLVGILSGAVRTPAERHHEVELAVRASSGDIGAEYAFLQRPAP
ncbi:LacI family DNA-binding transcriptional regulator [Streptomyces sp. T028]|uniref:LacI family DNA-binding transcriptional regulator n=1 Tax=Streptomyces sp. T028 TaxID=3394379 RepID=UPI003A8369CC